jgi:hypothetical protein
MQGLNSCLIYIPYCKKKETSQAGYQEENAQTKMKIQLIKKMIRNNTTRKSNNKKVSYHSISTKKLGQIPKKTQQPNKLTQQTPISSSKKKC